MTSRPATAGEFQAAGRGASADVLDGDWDPTAWWSTANAGEAMPGVLTPLSWTFWGPTGEHTIRRVFSTIGLLEGREVKSPVPDRERILAIFHGRVAAKVDFFAAMGDRLPGTSGKAVAEQILGSLPPGFPSTPTRRRLPALAVRFPRAFLGAPRRLRRAHTETHRWWSQRTNLDSLSLAEAVEGWVEAQEWFGRTLFVQSLALHASVQPVYDQLFKLAGAAGDLELASKVVAGQGSHVELAVVEDLWKLSRGSLGLDGFLAEHGYHGPHEGEISSHVWREDPGPVLALREAYRATPETESPANVARERVAEREQAKRELLARLPKGQRPKAELVLALANKYIPLRGVGKVAFLQSLDVARAVARRIGVLLAETGAIADPTDVFYLTADELRGVAKAASFVELVGERRAVEAEHKNVALPSSWQGRPELTVSDTGTAMDENRSRIELGGVGASPGTVQGKVRVLLEPRYDQVEAGEILVAPTTDPGWAGIMFVSAALVVDIGGLLSHAAVVARELGIPCVMGTGNGTTRLRTGDICRVDGHAGTVELLQPAQD